MSNGSARVGGLKLLKALVWVVYAIVIAASIIIAFAFFLLMFDANPSAGFAEFIYSAGTRFSAPFIGMIEPTKLSNGGVISWSALFAIAAYLVLGWIVATILDAISRNIAKKSRPVPVVQYAPQPAPQPGSAPVQQPVAAPTPEPAPVEPAPASVQQPMPAPSSESAPEAAPSPEPTPVPAEEAPAAPDTATGEPGAVERE